MTSTCSQSAPRLITFWPSSASLAKSADNIEGEIMVAGRSRPASLVGKGMPMVSKSTAKTEKTRDGSSGADFTQRSVLGLRTLTLPRQRNLVSWRLALRSALAKPSQGTWKPYRCGSVRLLQALIGIGIEQTPSLHLRCFFQFCVRARLGPVAVLYGS